MAKGFYITPSSRISTESPLWTQKLEEYIQQKAKSPETISVKEFSKETFEQITQEEENFLTTENIKIAIIIVGRLGYLQGVTRIYITEEALICMTQALVLEKAMFTLQENETIGEFHSENEEKNKATGPLGSALKIWIDQLLKV